ncbi:MAG: GMC family oxidoreductase [Burkholderiales bacterium]|nr:GMC family oxidoreductase [Burkholderiales bacterium]
MADHKRAPVDVVLVGFGWTGAIMAKELTDAGLQVLALERGEDRDTNPDFSYPKVIDELTYGVQARLFQDLSRETLTIRHGLDDLALPYRQYGSFLPGNGVGGAGVHWNGMHWRVLPSELRLRSHIEERYGRGFIPPDMTIQDFGVSYDELEPFFDHFERVCGVSGRAGNLGGRIVEGGNPFEGARSGEFPLPPLAQMYSGALFAKAAAELGYHPFPTPAANASREYTNPYGAQLGKCSYCGFCERFGCYNFSKASPQTTILPVLRQRARFTLRTQAHVLRVNLDRQRQRAVGVTYVDALGREIEQPAELVILCAYQLHNVRLMLLSGIGTPYDPRSGQGVVGKNYSYQMMGSVDLFFDAGTRFNPFVGAGAAGYAIDDLNGDHFDHGPLGFIGGAYVAANQTGGRPIQQLALPPGTPTWGAEWKQALKACYGHTMSISTHGTVMSYRDTYLDLDPNYRDAFGQPLLRMTFDWKENEFRMTQHVTEKAAEIARVLAPAQVAVKIRKSGEHYDTRPYQTTHNVGGAIMGSDPHGSALNRYLQSWDVHNVFVMGAGAFPQNIGYNPTGLVGALAYWSAKAIREQYLRDPRPLVSA